MPTIGSKLTEVLNIHIDLENPDNEYLGYEHNAKKKLYETLMQYRTWDIKSYRFTEQALYLKIQKGERVKRFGFYPVKYESIYVPNQTFTLIEDILDSAFYSPAEELYMKYLTCCASGFYNEFGSY